MKAAIISLESESSKWIVKAMQKYFDRVDSINIKEIEVRSLKNQIEILYNEKPKYANFEEAHKIMKVIDSILKSNKSGTWQKIYE